MKNWIGIILILIGIILMWDAFRFNQKVFPFFKPNDPNMFKSTNFEVTLGLIAVIVGLIVIFKYQKK